MNIKRELINKLNQITDTYADEYDEGILEEYSNKLEQIITDIWDAVENMERNIHGEKLPTVIEIQQKIESIIKGVDND